jgi:hypothetical protein
MTRTPNNGFVYIATVNKRYILSAVNSAETLRDHYPEANITLFTTPDMLDGVNDLEVFDQIITDGVPSDKRAKLWALNKTPYTITAYLDADTIIVSDEIANIFDQLGVRDIIFTKIRKYNSNPKGFIDDPEYIRHGGVFVYNDKADTLKFMQSWWDLWYTTRAASVFASTYDYPLKMKEWDQFYLFYLAKHTEHGLNLGFFENDARWNFVRGYLRSELGGLPPIVEHYTIDF